MPKEQQEWFAQVAHDKRATLSNSLTSLFTKERQERITLFHERITLSLTKNERIDQKKDERIPNPADYA